MKNSLHKILIWVIGFVITGMMTSCEDIFDELSVNPNQQRSSGYLWLHIYSA